jgi:hypothetical protein
MLALEQKRSERTLRPFALLLVDTQNLRPQENGARLILEVLAALQSDTRETDLIGWYEANVSAGVMFTEIMLDNRPIITAILSRMNESLRKQLTEQQFDQIKFSCQLFPEELGRIDFISQGSTGLPLKFAASQGSEGYGGPPE